MGKQVIQVELMEILGVGTAKTIRNYRAAGMPIFRETSKGKPNVFDTEDVIKWLIEKEIMARMKPAHEGEEEQEYIDKEYEQGRLARAQADGKEIDNKVRRNELVPLTLLGDILGRMSSQVSAVLDSIPQKIKRRVPSLSSNDIEIIKKEIAKTQNAASKMEVEIEQLHCG